MNNMTESNLSDLVKRNKKNYEEIFKKLSKHNRVQPVLTYLSEMNKILLESKDKSSVNHLADNISILTEQVANIITELFNSEFINKLDDGERMSLMTLMNLIQAQNEEIELSDVVTYNNNDMLDYMVGFRSNPVLDSLFDELGLSACLGCLKYSSLVSHIIAIKNVEDSEEEKIFMDFSSWDNLEELKKHIVVIRKDIIKHMNADNVKPSNDEDSIILVGLSRYHITDSIKYVNKHYVNGKVELSEIHHVDVGLTDEMVEDFIAEVVVLPSDIDKREKSKVSPKMYSLMDKIVKEEGVKRKKPPVPPRRKPPVPPRHKAKPTIVDFGNTKYFSKGKIDKDIVDYLKAKKEREEKEFKADISWIKTDEDIKKYVERLEKESEVVEEVFNISSYKGLLEDLKTNPHPGTGFVKSSGAVEAFRKIIDFNCNSIDFLISKMDVDGSLDSFVKLVDILKKYSGYKGSRKASRFPFLQEPDDSWKKFNVFEKSFIEKLNVYKKNYKNKL